MTIEPMDDEPVLAAPTAHPSTPPRQQVTSKKAGVPARAPQPEESFESARPGKFSLSTQEYIIACCLLDDGESLDKALAMGLSLKDFDEAACVESFRCLKDMRARGTPIAIDTLVEELGSEQVGYIGMTTLLALSDATLVGTTAHVAHRIQALLDASERARLERLTARAQEALKIGASPEDVVAILERAKGRSAKTLSEPRPITSFAYPSDDDPNMLLGSDDYLGRGGGLLFVSHAGAGKSSWAMDACMMWSLGRAWMQIKSHLPRKCLIIQAEDSDRYIGKIFASFAHANNLTEAELATLAENCIIVRLKGVSGDAFFAELTRLAAAHSPDLVIINPLYLYADGDITRSEFAQPFLLGLDRVNKAEKFAYILIHHTGKPQAKGGNGKRPELEDWESAYMGFGSSYLANWPRATILLEPVPGEMGRYQIKLGKGGLNAGVTRTVEQGAGARQEPTTRIAIRHSTDTMPVNGKERRVYYWEVDAEQPEPAAPKHPGGRGAKNKLSEFEIFFPANDQKFIPWGQMWNKAKEVNGIARNSFRDMCDREYRNGELERFIDPNLGACYRLTRPRSTQA